MELQEFIKDTLINIKNGIHFANVELAKQEGKELGNDFSALFVMEPNNREKGQGYITFDVAVTVGNESKIEGSGGIKIAIANIDGEISSESSQENISRIKFHIIPHTYIS